MERTKVKTGIDFLHIELGPGTLLLRHLLFLLDAVTLLAAPVSQPPRRAAPLGKRALHWVATKLAHQFQPNGVKVARVESAIDNLRDRVRSLVSRSAPRSLPARPSQRNGKVPSDPGVQGLLREVATLNDRVQVLSCRLETEREERAALRDDHAALQVECAALRARAETLVQVIEALHANLEDLRAFRDDRSSAPHRAWSRLAPIRGSRSSHD